ncbi:hypothetical protein pEaSNUABM17_00172 [Erwinia phage pEa_SNUABM_17]|uniref:Uncharacterized protein n=1 Tax=Erwinia phage pEa_SNUABM_17 TaxID=2869545 RepID=A0AAE8C3K9_9CAUD|nr:hypothetical protein MPK72_gp172 [Erwinia phage pEa_SNUABM_17]QZE57718.1 hypothetical protein pEaSNUABM17_00172 [Erwinia phage pEa_SNUABM_17]
MYEMTLPSGTVVSVSAANKKQVANAEILFGKNAKVLIKKIDELVKIKELDTAKLSAVLDLLNDADATTAFAKKAAGKNLVTAVKNLYKAKTLVAVINGLRAIKIKPVAIQQNAPAKTTRPVRANTVDANGKIERNKWYVIDHTRHANDIIIKGPFKTEAEAEKNVETGKSKRVIIQEALTGQDCLDQGLTWTQNPDMKQTGGTPGSKSKVKDKVRTFDPAYSVLSTKTARQYAPEFIRAVEPIPGAAKLLHAAGNKFSFTYKDLEVAVVMKQRGWLMTFIADHLKKVQNVQIHLGELDSITNVIDLFATKDPSAAQVNAAIKKGLRKL